MLVNEQFLFLQAFSFSSIVVGERFSKNHFVFLIFVQAFYLFTSVLVNLCSLVSIVVGEQFLFFDFCTSIFLFIYC